MTPVAAVEAVNASLYTAVESGDLDLMGAVWYSGPGEDGVTCVHPGWPLLRGRSTVLRSWAVIMAAVDYIQFFLTDVNVSTAGDVAVVTCTENALTGVGGDGESKFGFAGSRVVATNVFRRTASGWRLWAHHASPVLEPGGEDGEAGEPDAGEMRDERGEQG